MYEGDDYSHAYFSEVAIKWLLGTSPESGIHKGTGCIKTPEVIKAFSTKEAAEKWISKQNKPNEIKLTSILGHVNDLNKNYIDQYGRVITPQQIEEIYNAQKGIFPC